VPDLTHLEQLEAESIHILREIAAECRRPVMLYSIGKDSSVLLHLALKAFHPSKPPFPLLHVDTTWKFREMIQFRDETAARHGLDLIVHTNHQGIAGGVTPLTHGSVVYTDVMKTEALKQALDAHGFDAAFGGARRDEETSRAKERIVSVRSARHQWDPRLQRPELWRLYNPRVREGESVRVFPLSNWTELDVWHYIEREQLEIPAIYFAHQRSVFRRDGMLLANGPYVPLMPGEEPFETQVRFRTVGDMTCTGAVESEATNIDEVIEELVATRITERGATRADDRATEAAMEDRKREGYF
jgi:sulfate adenylyltransferase subunit 2